MKQSKKDPTNMPKRCRKEHPPPKSFKKRFLRVMLLGSLTWYPRICRLFEYIYDIFS